MWNRNWPITANHCWFSGIRKIRGRTDRHPHNTEEIQSYYSDNTELFLLDEPLSKARLIRMRLHSPYLPTVRNIYRSNTLEDLTQLERL